MKTKNIIAILAALPVLAGLVGCKSDDQPEAKPAKEILMVLGGTLFSIVPVRLALLPRSASRQIVVGRWN